MEILKKKYKGTSEYYKFDMEIEKFRKQIFKITKDDNPEFFLMEMLKSSASMH